MGLASVTCHSPQAAELGLDTRQPGFEAWSAEHCTGEKRAHGVGGNTREDLTARDQRMVGGANW